ncbi:MAG: FAD-binding protein [Brevinematales bacterium]|jgi:electron transfer flavoprotein alpha subunit
MNAIEIKKEKCMGCDACYQACSYHAIENTSGLPLINKSQCTMCGACVSACPYQAITRLELQQADTSEYSGICVYAEHRNGALSSIVPELIGAAIELKKDCHRPVSVILIGNNVRSVAEEILGFGVDEIWFADHPKALDFHEDIQVQLIASIVQKKKPEILIGGGAVSTRSIFPRVAVMLSTGLTADCTEISFDKESNTLKQIRPAFGGDILAEIVTQNRRPQMATVRHKVMKPAPKVNKPHGKIIEFKDFEINDSIYEIESYEKENGNDFSLTEADCIVSVGRGIQDPKNLGIIRNFAQTLGAALGASRPVIDSGWLPYQNQVGLTGKTVNPNIYIACGISGAIQHIAGIKNSGIIVAINKDIQAPIFQNADYGIVGDIFEVIPEIIRQINYLY